MLLIIDDIYCAWFELCNKNVENEKIPSLELLQVTGARG